MLVCSQTAVHSDSIDLQSTLQHSVRSHTRVSVNRKQKISQSVEAFPQLTTSSHAKQVRIVELSKLEDGWCNEEVESKGPSIRSIGFALKILDEIPKLLDLISVYPAYEGGILFEYQFSNWDYTVKFCNSEFFEIYGIEIVGDGSYDKVFTSFEDLLLKIKSTVGL